MKRSSVFSYVGLAIVVSLFTNACSVNKKISKQAAATLLKDSAILPAHMGISIFEPATGKYWYNHNAEKYFIPASNTKLFSLYAGMKYLGDSIPAAYFREDATTLHIYPAGDPSFLNEEYAYQPLLEMLKKTNKQLVINDGHWREKPLGLGWAWDDYSPYYTTERAALPVFGDVVNISGNVFNNNVSPSFFKDALVWDSAKAISKKTADADRKISENIFVIKAAALSNTATATFLTQNGKTNYNILADSLQKNIQHQNTEATISPSLSKIQSQPADSLFKPMMHRSDNFFAEQTLLMASNEKLGYMKDADMIAYILQHDLGAIPQKPKWVDGSGLSRYNLFTPQSFVYLLNKLKDDFGLDRLQQILATGGEGTLRAYYLQEAGYIWAKTGTLSNNCALSGYLITKKGKLLIFSVLANNYPTAATPVRRAVEKFLQGLRNNF